MLDFITGENDKTADIRLYNGKGENEWQFKGTAYFTDIRLEEVTETTNEWNVLVVCFRNADVKLIKNGKTTNYKVSFKDSVVDDLNERLNNFRKDCNDVFQELLTIKNVDFKVSDVPVRKMKVDSIYENGDPRYAPDFTDPDVVKEVNGFLKNKQYQHLIFITPLHGEGTNSPMNGQAGSDFNYGIPTIQVVDEPEKTNLTSSTILPTELFIHETIHTLERDTALLTGNSEVHVMIDLR